MALTSEQAAALMTNVPFRGRCKVSCLKYADVVFIEAPNTPAHSTRLRWADQTFRNPDEAARLVQSPVVMDPAIASAGIDPSDGDSTATDAALQMAVEAVINKLL